jgi:DNA adenine methylase
VSLECRPALEIIAKYGQHPGVCLYVDPPYEGVTRPKKFDGYRCEMRATDDHRDLLEQLTACEASVILSGYRSDTYDEMLDGWDMVEIPHHTGQGKTGAGARTEVLWSNRPIAVPSLFDTPPPPVAVAIKADHL